VENAVELVEPIVNLLTSREEFRSLRGRFGLFDMAIQCCASPQNVQIFSHEVSKLTGMYTPVTNDTPSSSYGRSCAGSDVSRMKPMTMRC